MMNHWQPVLSFDESDISLESVIAFNSFPGPSESKGGHSFDRSRLIVVSISHCNVHHMRPETRQHIIVSPPPFRLIVECQVSKLLASSPGRKYYPLPTTPFATSSVSCRVRSHIFIDCRVQLISKTARKRGRIYIGVFDCRRQQVQCSNE